MKTHRTIQQSALALLVLAAPSLVACVAAQTPAMEQVKSSAIETTEPQRSAFTNEACMTVSKRSDVRVAAEGDGLRIRFELPAMARGASVTEATVILSQDG